MAATALPRADELSPFGMTIPQVALALGVSEYSVRRRIWEGELPAVKVFGRWWIRPSDLHKRYGVDPLRPSSHSRTQPAKRARRR